MRRPAYVPAHLALAAAEVVGVTDAELAAVMLVVAVWWHATVNVR